MKKFLSLLLSIVMVFSCLSCLTILSVGATQDRTSYFNKNYTLTGNPIDDIVAVAQAQANRTKAQMGYTEAWCANFVGDCASLAGLGDIIPRNGYCGTLYSNILNAGGKEVTSPQKGDIIFYYCTASSCPNSGKPWVHVGIMTSPTSSIEGNSGGKVAVKSKVTYTDMNGHTYGHSGTNSVIAKYLRPNYPSKEPVNNNPQGYFDWVRSDNPGEIHLRGWAFDRDDVNAEILLHVYVDDKHYATLKADKSRPDVNEAHSGVGNNHGFEDVLVVNKSGNLNVKVFAINIGNGSNTLIENGEKNVSVTTDPSTPKRMKECTLDGHTYRLYACSTTWENAKAICESKGGYLATITSEREQFALYKLLSEYSPNNFYLGGTSTSGSWEWVTGEPFSYTAWAESQPDCAGNNEFYLGAYKHSSTNRDLKFWNDFTNNYSGITGFVFESGDLEEDKVVPSDNPPTISYTGFIGDSWTKDSVNGEIIGTENAGRFKALKIGLENCEGGIKYSAHFANDGWSDYVQDGEICGSTTDSMSSIEALKMELYGDIASSYNVFYSAYVRDKGWLEWAKNGEISGSTGGSLPITAIKVMLVPQVRYASHIEDKGWTERVKDREISGTVGEGLQLESLQIYLKDTSYGNIRYKTHLEDLGWGSSVYNGKESGTTSLGLRAEALTVALDGKASDLFDVMYKVHLQDKDWTSWVRNGASAGTTGQELRMEAFKVMVVPKGYTGAETFKELTAEQFTVTFNPMGGECDVKSKPISYCGFFKNLPTPQKKGYSFVGWYDSKDYNNLVTASSTLETKSNITLYAKWEQQTQEPTQTPTVEPTEHPTVAPTDTPTAQPTEKPTQQPTQIPTVEPTKPQVEIGDANVDGRVNIFDATEIQLYLAEYKEFTDIQMLSADADKDGKVNIFDVTRIQLYLAEYITEL